jgi:hypothetical protein
MARKRGRPKKLPPTDREMIIRQFQDAALPVLTVDLELNVNYANEYARAAFPVMEMPDGLRSLIPADSVEECCNRIAKGENFRLDLSPLKAAKAALAFSPFSGPDGSGRAEGALVVVTYTDSSGLSPMEVVSESGAAALSSGFRQPLSEIFATLAVMGRKLHVNAEKQYDQYLADINRASYQLLRNTNNIVSQLRPFSGTPAPAPVVDFWQLMSELLEACGVLLHPTDIPFIYDLPQEKAQVRCCFDEIAEAVVNLISNSYHFSKPGNRVTVTGRNLANAVVVTISDEGCGISSEQLNLIFSPYYSRGNGGEPFTGLGMGLNVARQNIGRNGGTLAVNSSPETGTSVAFTLPTTQEMAAPRATLESGSAVYLRDRFSVVYVGLCDVITPPEQ